MSIPLRATDTTRMTATPATRWSEYARAGRVFCGPAPIGHHIATRFQIPESGFIQCTSPALPAELLELKRLRESRSFADADRLERSMRANGVEVPDQIRLRQMSKDSPMCGRWVFLFAIRGGGIVIAEVSRDDRMAMEGLSTPAEMIEYLGIFPSR